MSSAGAFLGGGKGARGWARLRALASRIDSYLILVILLPFAVLTYYRSWLITYPDFLDPWYSVGYFLDLPGTLRSTPGWYGSDRLAYWIPGSVVYHLFPPLLANYVLRLGYYLAATLALYVTVSRTVGRKTALAATLILGTYWHFLNDIGWHYVDGVGVAYTLLSAAALTLAGSSRRRGLWMLAAGFWFAAAVNTNFFLLEMLLPLAVYHIGACRIRGSTRRLGWDLGAFLSGAVGLTAVLALYFYLVTGGLLFSCSVRFCLNMYRGGAHRSTVSEFGQEVPPFLQWFRCARWLDVPNVVLVAAGVSVLGRLFARRAGRTDADRFASLFQWTYLVHFGVFAVCQSRGINLLFLALYSIYLIPVMMLAVAGLIARTTESLRPVTVVLLCGAGLLFASYLFHLGAVPAGQSAFLDLCHSTRFKHQLAAWFELALLAALLGVLLVGRTRWGTVKGVAFALLLAGCAVFNYIGATPFNYGHAPDDPCAFRYRRDAYLALFDGIRTVRREHLGVGSVQFWFRREGPLAEVFSSLNSAYLWGCTRYGLEFPDLPTVGDRPVAPDRSVLVLLTPESGAFATARDALRKVHVEARLLQEQSVRRGEIAFTLTLIHCDPAKAVTKPGAVPVPRRTE